MILLFAMAQAADLHLQARLLDPTGDAYDGDLSVTVRFLDDPSADPPAATELFAAPLGTVSFQDGYLSATVSDVPDAVFLGDAWVEYTVGSVTLANRHPVTSTGRAAVAERLVRPATALQWHEGAYRTSSGAALSSCAAYLTDPGWRGETWERFWVDVDGEGGQAPTPILCDMETDGGGWAVFEAPGGPWGWNTDGTICYDVELFTYGQAWQMSAYPHSEHFVDTDTVFWFQEDDSANTGRVYARTFASIADEATFRASSLYQMHFTTTSSNHVHVEWSPNGYDRVIANCATSSNGCGTAGIPANGADSTPLFLVRIDANPNSSCGSTASNNQWFRNGTSLEGSYYRVFLR